MVDILKGTMAKRINGVETHFYPQTSGDMAPEIKDEEVSTVDTWSSKQIVNFVEEHRG